MHIETRPTSQTGRAITVRTVLSLEMGLFLTHSEQEKVTDRQIRETILADARGFLQWADWEIERSEGKCPVSCCPPAGSSETPSGASV